MTTTAYNNAARGLLDIELSGRFDLPIYKTGYEVFRNFRTNFKGNIFNRRGYERVTDFVLNSRVALRRFSFNYAQTYLVACDSIYLTFYTYDSNNNFGLVQSGGSPVQLNISQHGWTREDFRDAQTTQNADVMILCTSGKIPLVLTRTSATAFTLQTLYSWITAGSTVPNEPINACRFYSGRLYLGGSTSYPTRVWASESGVFKNFILPSSTITDASPMQYNITDIAQPIEWLFGGQGSLFIGSGDGVLALNGGSNGQAIKPDSVESTLTAAQGASRVEPIRKDGKVFFVGLGNRNMYTLGYDVLTEAFLPDDLNLISYAVTREGVIKIRRFKDREDSVYGLKGNGELVSVIYSEKEKIVAWCEEVSQLYFDDIENITDNFGVEQLFASVHIKETNTNMLVRLSADVEFADKADYFGVDEKVDYEALQRRLAEQLFDCNYMDASIRQEYIHESLITFNPNTSTIIASTGVFDGGDVGRQILVRSDTGYEYGRFEIETVTNSTQCVVRVVIEPSGNTFNKWSLSFDAITIPSYLVGRKVGLVLNGGFWEEIQPTSTTITLDRQRDSASVGLMYNSIAKSFVINNQTTFKFVHKAGFRCINSASGLFGTSFYRLAPLQQMRQGDLNYMPPKLINETVITHFSDDTQRDKSFFVVQKDPLPLTVTSVFITTSEGEV